MSIKQSFQYGTFKPKDLTLDELCQRAAGIGYAGIELTFRNDDFEPLVEAAHKHGLTVTSMCGHRSLGEGMNRADQHERIVDELHASIDVAAAHGIPNLICFSGNRNEGQSDDQGADACAECMRRIAPYAEQKGVTLTMELLNSKVDHPEYQCDHTNWGVAMCERVNSPRVKLLYDVYHMQIMEGDVIRTISDHIQWIGHFHTAGNPGRHDLDDQQELYYPAIARAIAATGYDGFVAHEFRPKAEPLAALEAAFEQCRG